MAAVVSINELEVDKSQTIAKTRATIIFKGRFKGSIEVAVKRFVREYDDEKEKHESDLLKTCDSHEHIVRHYATEKDNDFMYIAMELCAGTLEHLVDGTYRGRQVGSAYEVLRQIASGLHYLHNNKVVHRDLKPQNILISIPSVADPLPKMKLADFGISRHRKDDKGDFTYTGFAGTVGWSAPELYEDNALDSDTSTAAANEKRYDFSIDIFSLGCVFGYVLTGHHPFGDVAPTRLSNIKQNQLKWNEEYTIHDDNFKQLVKRMIAAFPDMRPTIEQVLESRQFKMENKSVFVTKPVTAAKSCRLHGMWLSSRVKNGKRKHEYLVASSDGRVFSANPKAMQRFQKVQQFEGIGAGTCLLQLDELILTGNNEGKVSLYRMLSSCSRSARRQVIHQETIELKTRDNTSRVSKVLDVQASPGRNLAGGRQNNKLFVVCETQNNVMPRPNTYEVFFVLIERVRNSGNDDETKYCLHSVGSLEMDFAASYSKFPVSKPLIDTSIIWFGPNIVMMRDFKVQPTAEFRLYEWRTGDTDIIVECGRRLAINGMAQPDLRFTCSPRAYQTGIWLLACFNKSNRIIEVWSVRDAENGENCIDSVSFSKHAYRGMRALSWARVDWVPAENFTPGLDTPIIASTAISSDMGNQRNKRSSTATASGSGKLVFIWNALTGDVLHELDFEPHLNMRSQIYFASTGNLFVTITSNDTHQIFKIWSYEQQHDGELHILPKDEATLERGSYSGVWGVSWDLDGKNLAFLWDIAFWNNNEIYTQKKMLTFWGELN